MAVRIALLLMVILPLQAGIASGQSTVICEFSGRGFAPLRVRFTPDGRFLLVAGAITGDVDGNRPELRVWDIHAGEFVADHSLDARGSITGLHVAPDGETLLVTTVTGRNERNSRPLSNHRALLWRWQMQPVRPRSRQMRSSLTPLHELCRSQHPGMSPDSWVPDGTLLSPDGALIAVHRLDTRDPNEPHLPRTESTVELFDRAGAAIGSVTLTEPRTNGIAFLPDRRNLVTCTVVPTDPNATRCPVRIELRLWDVDSGAKLVCQSVTDTTSRPAQYTPGWGTNYITGVAVSGDGTLIASGGPDFSIQLWNGKTLEPLRTLLGPADELTSLAISPDGALVAATSVLKRLSGFEGDFFLWDSATGELRWRRDEPEQPRLHEATFSPDGGWLVTRGESSLDGGKVTIRLWDVNQLLAIGAAAD